MLHKMLKKNSRMIKFTYFIITIIISLIQIKSDLSPDNVLFAINCGGDSLTDSKGIFYEKVNNKILKNIF